MTTVDLEIDLIVEAGNWPDESELKRLAGRALYAAAQICSDELPDSAEVSLVFHNDSGVRSLNKDWREQDKPTNVLSFSANEDAGPISPLLGDIVFAHETIVREAAEQSKSFDDHLAHLLVHGFLHLLGYDHLENEEAEEMEALEVKVLASLNIANPYADTIPV